ncbi:STAS domain-containing protein [Streptomyces sp. MBT65]|uniref:STAS domain-containing protein n=1 Tax=Streptomyces sp. MBT65 TaxID=1488395 RepID=UPI00190A6C78|nr:STAS domain-containing protein [Streptomyces sp. MBT65]MBK3576466.1 STAS domain-containing protein [Streptomyces sp. MBT65]
MPLRAGWCAGKSGRRRIRRARKASRAAQTPPRHPDRTIVRLRGEVASRRAPSVVVEVDLGKVTYLAPEVRGLLLAAAATARRSGACFVITRASPPSLRGLEELGMQR